MIVDAHVHVSNRMPKETATGVLQRGAQRSMITFDAASLLREMAFATVDKAVILQGPYHGNMNDIVRKAVSDHPDRFVGAMYVDPWASDYSNSIEALLPQPEFSVVKLECTEATGLFGMHPQASLADSRITELCRILERSGHVLTLDLGPIGSRSYQTDVVRNLATRFPDLLIVICHLGQPDFRCNQDRTRSTEWERQIKLGMLPNVFFDTAAIMNGFPQESYPFPGAGKYLQRAIHMIGTRKILWGTDIPGLLKTADYRDLTGLFNVWVGDYPEEDRVRIMMGNAKDVYFK